MRSSGLAVVLLLLAAAGCAGPGARPDPDAPPDDAPCAVCATTFDVCRKADDYDPCLAMRRFCTRWCAEAETCAEACEGARWGCDAVVDIRRTTCDKADRACAAHCEALGDGGGGDGGKE